MYAITVITSKIFHFEKISINSATEFLKICLVDLDILLSSPKMSISSCWSDVVLFCHNTFLTKLFRRYFSYV